MSHRPITAIIVGAGHRALLYASWAKLHPDRLRIVGVADPVAHRRETAAREFGFGPDACFASAEELARKGRRADAIINGTMDRQHVSTAIPLLEAGYDMLLEKPFAVDEDEMWRLIRAVRTHGNTVMICHILRYAPFYAEIRRVIAEGAIGAIINIQTTEHVSFHHLSVSYVRGKHANRAAGGCSMLVSKCCHDLDLIMWLKSGIRPTRVAGFGGIYQFRSDLAPQDAGTRCLVDCPIESACRYSARKIYLDHPDRWSFYVWSGLETKADPTLDDKRRSLEVDNPHGLCVWKCDNDVVDHQSVAIEFEDGATATHNMIGGSAKGERTLRIIGTHGEIEGCFSEGRFALRRINPGPGRNYDETRVDVNADKETDGSAGGHGGGDLRLVADFVSTLAGEPRSISCSRLEDSVYGLLTAFRADQAMEQGRVQLVPAIGEKLTAAPHAPAVQTARTEWRPVRIRAYGLQQQLEREWNVEPAWDIHAVYTKADGELLRSDGTRETHVFWNRHIDRRFHIEYPRTTREAPRVRGRTVVDPDREWDTVIEHRDRYLREAGLTLEGPPEAITKRLADTFKYDNAFKDKPECPTFATNPRHVTNPIEGLLHQAFCVGCAHAFAALADACGLPARTVGWGGHRLAEVCIEGRWHMVENSCRHPNSRGLEALFSGSVMSVLLEPTKYLDCMPASRADMYLGVPYGQYHFMGGSWQSPMTLRFAAGNAYALYPELDRWGFKSKDGTRVPIVLRANGFYWEDTVHPEDEPRAAAASLRNIPFPIGDRVPVAAFLYHPLRPGERLRQSVWLDDLDGMTGLEVSIPVAPEPHLDFGPELGRRLVVRAGDWEKPLSALGAWPGSEPDNRGHRRCTFVVPAAALRPRSVNWIEFRNAGLETLQAPFIPAAMEPYIPPLGSRYQGSVMP